MDNSIQHIDPLKCKNVLLLWASFAIPDNIILDDDEGYLCLGLKTSNRYINQSMGRQMSDTNTHALIPLLHQTHHPSPLKQLSNIVQSALRLKEN